MTAKKKIDSLTKEQEDQIPLFRDKWIQIGLSTEPLNLESAKKAAINAYELAGLAPPKNFFTAKSPLDAINLITRLSSYKTKEEVFNDPAFVPSDPSKSKKQILAEMSFDPSSTPKSKSEILNEMSFGCHDANWLGFFEYFKDVVGIDECKKAEGLIELAHHCGWVSFYEDTVVFQDRPCVIKMDENNRTHCETGPAIAYSDGLAVYVWHGVSIPSEWIEKKHELKPETALSWENIEQRRCACEILGWVKILDQLGGKVIDKDDDPEIGTLVEVNIPEIGKERFLRVLCGTKREFAFPVPPDTKTALDGNAWSYGLDGKDLLNLEVRT